MKWPWHRHDQGEHERAEEALRRTRGRRQEQERRDDRFLPVADRIRRMRERNHLAEAIESALREGR